MVATTKEFEVRVRQREYVAPKHEIEDQKISLSNLDLLLPPEDVGVFLCYKTNPYRSFGQMVSTLKLSLGQVLVHFYVFSSQVVHNSLGEAEIKCDNHGVEFIEAYGDSQLMDLNFYNPNDSVEAKLLPLKQRRVLSVQVTRLKCGGTVVGCKFDHRVADAYSANMFLVSWAELANSSPISTPISFTKALLKARHPPSYDPSLNHMYTPISSLNPNKDEISASQHNPLTSRIYKVNANEIRNLQSQAKGTKFESFSAFLWKLISKHASVSEVDSKMVGFKTCKMGIVVDGRSRLATQSGDKPRLLNMGNTPLSNPLSSSMAERGNNTIISNQKGQISCYFGNVLSIPYEEKTINELNMKPLEEVAKQVHKCVEKATSKEHFRDLIDWVEVHRPEPCLARIYSGELGGGPAFVVSSGQQFPVSKIDFGWGNPVFGSYHFPWSSNAGYVMPMPSSKANGDWIVYMLLTEGQLKFIEKEASYVFKPFKL